MSQTNINQTKSELELKIEELENQVKKVKRREKTE
jgi:hypothetical protein